MLCLWYCFEIDRKWSCIKRILHFFLFLINLFSFPLHELTWLFEITNTYIVTFYNLTTSGRLFYSRSSHSFKAREIIYKLSINPVAVYRLFWIVNWLQAKSQKPWPLDCLITGFLNRFNRKRYVLKGIKCIYLWCLQTWKQNTEKL